MFNPTPTRREDLVVSDHHENRARHILQEIAYATIATSSPDTGPWNTPVFVAFGDSGNLYWTSSPASRHSQNISDDDRVFVVIFDSTARAGEGEGVYIRARAEQLRLEGEIDAARTALNQRADSGALESDAYYVAIPQQVWVNDIETDSDGRYLRDCRVELDRRVLRNSTPKKGDPDADR